MELVELVIVACLLKDPGRCETFRVPLREEVSMVQCVWRSQLQAAAWAGDYPDWRIKRFACELPQA